MHRELTFTDIEQFLEGKDPQKYITAIEGTYYEDFVYLITNDPDKGKEYKQHTYTPFVWMKDDVVPFLYEGSRTKLKRAMAENGIKIKKLISENNDGETPERFKGAFNFMVKCKGGSYSNLLNFFKAGGVDIYDKAFRESFVTFSPVEQFMIQTGKRLFKGMDDYNDIHRVQFDLETTGLNPSVDNIFQIGIKDNRGFEVILETKGSTPSECRDSERENIELFFFLIHELKFDTLAGYNSDNFDFPFFNRRCERLGLDITKIAKTLHPDKKIKWKETNLKLGGESEIINQTLLWGGTVLDISHSVRRAQAINSDIKKWGLKYITEFSGVKKKNRVYVPGNLLNSTWADPRPFWLNDSNGEWDYQVGDFIPDGCEIVTGAYIVQRYLIDDLWETEQVDYIFNQASYLIAKLLPTTYGRSSTMGTAGQWKLIMAAWSYENGLAIPNHETKRNFTGGLSRLLEVGYAKDVSKLDFAALYPKIQLTHDIFPELDISGVMKLMLTYIVDKRDEFKFLTSKHKSRAKELVEKLEENKDSLEEKVIKKVKEAISNNKMLASNFDKKQLPLKILANSFFGAYGAPHIFNWGEMNKAEETTCRGRQYLRLMVKHFTEKYNFRPLVGDSVTFDTPIYIKNKNGINIVPICDIFDEISMNVDGQQRDFTSKDYEILTNSGWKTIDYVYRHKTNKQIFDIRTKNRHIRLTEDHSIFVNGIKKKPSELNVNDKIDVYDIPNFNLNDEISEKVAWSLGVFVSSDLEYDSKVNQFSEKFLEDCFTSYGKKKVPQLILNSTNNIKQVFLDGFNSNDKSTDSLTCVGGLTYLMNCVGRQHEISIDGLVDLKVKETNNEVGTNDEILFKGDFKYDGFVYDVSTEDGSFIAGVNGVSCSNTDGFNFAMPDNIDDITYVCKANHWKTEKYKEGQLLVGLEAVLSEFNEEYMIGRMGLDIDDVCSSTINFKRKNYANAIDGKIKLVGNSIKSKSMPVYIEEFVNKGIRLLLDGKGYEFVEYYYDYVDKIYNYQIPIAKIASKSKVKMSVDNYVNNYCRQKNKAGRLKNRQAHMELVKKHNLDVNLGDVIYYVNTGLGNSVSDIKKHTDKETGSVELEFNCELIDSEQLENNPDLTLDNYNVVKYISSFNKRINNLLVCFSPEIRDIIKIEVKKDKKTKIFKLEDRNYFSRHACELTRGTPLEESDQDDYDALMVMEDKEIKFWHSVNMIPNNIDESEWYTLRDDYLSRMEKLRLDGIKDETEKIIVEFEKVEFPDFINLENEYEIPNNLSNFVNMVVDEELNKIVFVSNMWGVQLSDLDRLMDFKEQSKERFEFYKTVSEDKQTFEEWDKFKNPEKYRNMVVVDKNQQISINF